MRFLRCVALVSFSFALVLCGFGQPATGVYPYGAFDNRGFDTIDLGNLNVHFSIPVIYRAGRGAPFYYNLAYDSLIWYPALNGQGQTQWTPVTGWGWHGDTELATGYMTFTASGGVNSNFVYHDSLGVSHPFPAVTTSSSSPSGSQTSPDGSGLTLNVSSQTSCVIYTRTGAGIAVPNTNNGAATYTDANGNQISVNSSGQFTDTLGTVALTISSGTSPKEYSYTNPTGGTSIVKVYFTSYTVATDFGVSGVNEYPRTAVGLISSVNLPNGIEYNITYETLPTTECTPLGGTNGTNCLTGRIASIHLSTGATLTYTYSGGDNGILGDGSTATLKRNDGNNWTYSRTGSPGPGAITQTTKADPSGNETVYTFSQDNGGGTNNLYPIEIKFNQGSSTVLSTVIQCFNAGTQGYSGCGGEVVKTPIYQIDSYTELPNGQTRLSELVYDQETQLQNTFTYGNLVTDREYNYGVALNQAPGTTDLVRETDMTYNYPTGYNGVFTELASTTVNDWSSGSAKQIAKSNFQYDQGTLANPTTTPTQWTNVNTAYRGNLTETSYSTGTTTLNAYSSYFNTGMIDTSTAVNGAVTTYLFGTSSGSCNEAFPTEIKDPVVNGLQMDRTMTWNCNGGVMTGLTDENGHTSSAGYTDPNFWRPTSTTDQGGNVTTISYPGQSQPMIWTESSLPIVSGIAVSDLRTTTDNLGRPMYVQREQGPSDANYDTVETDYNNDGLPDRITMPYTAPASPSSGNSAAPGVGLTYDALGRVLTSTDEDGGEVQFTYTNNDVVQEVHSSVQTFIKEFQYDGLGRLTAVCEVAPYLSGAGSCGLGVSETGFLTNYTYDALGHLTKVTQNAQPNGSTQTRSFAYDQLGRMTSETDPESGNKTYNWDSWSDCSPSSFPGDLVGTRDNLDHAVCYTYDAWNRVTQAMTTNGTGACRSYVYDSATPPSGVSVGNGKTRLIEANTAGTCGGTLRTDEWFGYGPRGVMTAFYESTPNSGGYYSTTASYYPNYALESIGGIPQTPTIDYGAGGYGLDGEGRYTQITDSNGNSPMQSATYATSSTANVLGSLRTITFGSGDSEQFTSDPNTGRMTQYQSTVSAQTDTGTLGWDVNGTLTSLNIVDNIPDTTDSQSCTYAYDGISRIKSTSCGSQGSQTYTYDAFGNISKTANGLGSSFLPSSYTNNQAGGYSYDGTGDMLTDNLHNSYTWDIYGDMLSVTSGGSTATATYDALGRVVETSNPFGENGYWDSVYAPGLQPPAATIGNLGGQALIPLPGGTEALYSSETLIMYLHADWLGSSRTASYSNDQSLSQSTAYAPFGELYASSTSGLLALFTGQLQNTAYSIYDFPFRRLSQSQGRWLSPDPAGVAAVDPTNPQSWNRYAYVLNNPLAYTDPTGMNHCDLWAGCGSGCANDPNCGNGDDTSDGFSSWFGFGGGEAEQEVELYGQSYCDLPGACGFGTQGFFGEWAYQNMVDSSSGGNAPLAPGETIYVYCTGLLGNFSCLPAFFSWEYFAPGMITPWYYNPDAQQIYQLASQVTFEAQHPMGHDLHSSMCNYFTFAGLTIAGATTPASAGYIIEGGSEYIPVADRLLTNGLTLAGNGIAVGGAVSCQ